MTRALVTFGVGPHADLLQIARPSFERFATRHGYDLIVAQPRPVPRPPSWWKLPVLSRVLYRYDEALWIDADVVITDSTEDVPVPAGRWQAMVEHHTADGQVPNLGVWLLRKPMRALLPRMWDRAEYINHGWWEQAAMLDLLGYQHQQRPARLTTPTALYDRTEFLDLGWNVHRNDHRTPARPRFLHATMHPNRAAVMRRWADVREAA